MTVVPGACVQLSVVADPFPRVAAVVRQEQAASSAWTKAHTRPGLAGEAATPILPSTPSGMPGLRVISAQVSPPSTDL